MNASAGASSSDAGKVALVARGPGASASKSVNHSDAVASSPGRLCTVWRIQTPAPPPGRVALR